MAIDIKKLNEDYLKQSDILKKLNEPGGLKDTVSQLEEQLAVINRDYKLNEINLKYAESRNDTTTIENLKKEKEALVNKFKTLQPKILKANEHIANQKSKVDSKFEELSKDPETKQKLDTILYKRYDRKKKQEFNKLQQLQKIQEILNSHPNVQKLLKGIENHTQAINNCKGIIKTLSAKSSLTTKESARLAKAQSELPNLETKRDQIRANFVNYFSKNHAEIDTKLLENIHSAGNLNRQIQGCEKSIGNYEKAMDQLSVSKQFETPDHSAPKTTKPLPSVVIDKPSWFFHPIKRIKYAINQRKIAKESEPKPTTPDSNSKKDFMDSLKLSKDEYNAEIVQKYLDSYQDNLHKVARQKTTNSEQTHADR